MNKVLIPILLSFALLSCSGGISPFYAVTPSGTNVSIDPNTAVTVLEDNTVDFTVTVDAGYTLSSTVGGTCAAGSWADNIYTTGGIISDCTVEFEATLVNYIVTPSGSNVTISPSAAQTVADGGTAQFTVTADAGYELVEVVGGTCATGSWSGTTYTTDPIAMDCTVEFAAGVSKVIFITAISFSGNLGGIAGADALCMADANKPAGGATYKAMIVYGTDRVACTSADCMDGGSSENVDWVLAPRTSYYRPDLTTKIGTTLWDNGIFLLTPDSNLDNSFSAGSYDIWTGLMPTWVSDPGCCDGWQSSGNPGPTGPYGSTIATDSLAINSGVKECLTANKSYLACVEQ